MYKMIHGKKQICFRSVVAALALISLLLSGRQAEAGDAMATASDLFAVLLPATAGVATLGLKDWEGTRQLVESTALALGSTLALKYSVDEKRPNGKKYSFPSGHSAIAFSSAEFIRNRYGWESGIPAYLVATFVGYSRIETREHYFHDVLAGAAIGVASSYLFTTPYRELKISGETGQGYYGVRVSSNW